MMEKLKLDLAQKERELIELTRKKNAEEQALKIDQNQLRKVEEKVKERTGNFKQFESKIAEINSQKTHLMMEMREMAMKLQQSLRKQ